MQHRLRRFEQHKRELETAAPIAAVEPIQVKTVVIQPSISQMDTGGLLGEYQDLNIAMTKQKLLSIGHGAMI